jgi:hypothetical protein
MAVSYLQFKILTLEICPVADAHNHKPLFPTLADAVNGVCDQSPREAPHGSGLAMLRIGNRHVEGTLGLGQQGQRVDRHLHLTFGALDFHLAAADLGGDSAGKRNRHLTYT